MDMHFSLRGSTISSGYRIIGMDMYLKGHILAIH